MKDTIIFFGTPPFAVNCLEALVEKKFNIAAVVTVPDRPAGRGKKISTSAAKQYALSKGILLLQPTNLKDPAFLKQLEDLQPELMVVVAFRMLPKEVWSMPPKGTINLHASLLPNYRGAAPIHWAVINREEKSGVSTFFINEKIDTGDLLLQESTTLTTDETAGTLHDKLASMGARLVCHTVRSIFDGNIKTQKQKLLGNEKLAPKLDKDNVFLDWSQSLETIEAKIRGLSPYPGAKTLWQEDHDCSAVKILEAEIVKTIHDFKPKKVIVKDQKILIAHPSGFLNCTVLQFPNKKRMRALDILNGSSFSSNLEVN